MSTKLAQLKEKLKKVAQVKGQIIFIPRGVQSFRCENIAHGKKEMVYHSFTPRIDEIECDCGIIYRKEPKKQ